MDNSAPAWPGNEVKVVADPARSKLKPKRITQIDAVVQALKEIGHLGGDDQSIKKQSDVLARIYGSPVQNGVGKLTERNCFRRPISTLRCAGVVKKLPDHTWVFADDYEEKLRIYNAKEAKKNDKVARAYLRALVDKDEVKADNQLLEEIGDQIPGAEYLKAADKREAGCRKRAEDFYGGKAMFTGETEPSAWQASHSIEVRACRSLVDNSKYNILLMRNDLHSMHDTPGDDGYPLEVHVQGYGLILRINSKDLHYRIYDGLFHEFPSFPLEDIRKIQTRVIIGNIARHIEQDFPSWFDEWRRSMSLVLPVGQVLVLPDSRIIVK